jgi:hypothetical protein
MRTKDVVVLAVKHGAQVIREAEQQRPLLALHSSVRAPCMTKFKFKFICFNPRRTKLPKKKD